MGFLIVPNLVPWLIVSDQFCWTDWQGQDKQGCHRFQGQGKVRKFFKTLGKIFDIVKVSEKSGNSVFRFILHKFSSRFWNHFLLEKTKRMLQSKTVKWSIWHSTPETCSSCGQWFLLWMLSSKFVLPLSAKSGKRLKMKRKLRMACKKG